jgi:hypothetical protein
MGFCFEEVSVLHKGDIVDQTSKTSSMTALSKTHGFKGRF